MVSRFVIHRHKTGRSHFDLRFLVDGILRSWSLLREPPARPGERRLAIERESFTPESIDARFFTEQAFGAGSVHRWDEGEVEITSSNPAHILLVFRGGRISGPYELRRTRWYPGNRWLLRKQRMRPSASSD